MGDQQRFFIFSEAIGRSDTGLAIADCHPVSAFKTSGWLSIIEIGNIPLMP